MSKLVNKPDGYLGDEGGNHVSERVVHQDVDPRVVLLLRETSDAALVSGSRRAAGQRAPPRRSAGAAEESEGFFLCGASQLEQPCVPPKQRSSCEDQRLTRDSINPPFHVCFGSGVQKERVFMAPLPLKEAGTEKAAAER